MFTLVILVNEEITSSEPSLRHRHMELYHSIRQCVCFFHYKCVCVCVHACCTCASVFFWWETYSQYNVPAFISVVFISWLCLWLSWSAGRGQHSAHKPPTPTWTRERWCFGPVGCNLYDNDALIGCKWTCKTKHFPVITNIVLYLFYIHKTHLCSLLLTLQWNSFLVLDQHTIVSDWDSNQQPSQSQPHLLTHGHRLNQLSLNLF